MNKIPSVVDALLVSETSVSFAIEVDVLVSSNEKSAEDEDSGFKKDNLNSVNVDWVFPSSSEALKNIV